MVEVCEVVSLNERPKTTVAISPQDEYFAVRGFLLLHGQMPCVIF